MSRSPRFAPAVFVVLILVAAQADAGWVPSGVQFCGRGRDPGAAPDGEGGMYGTSWDGSHVLPVRHLSITGDDAPGWTSAGAIVTTIQTETTQPRLAADGQGGVFIAFLSTGCSAHCYYPEGLVEVQHLTSTGARPAGWSAEGRPAVTTLNGNLGWTANPPVLVPDGLFGAILAWTWRDITPTGYAPSRVVIQRLDPAGDMAWAGSANGLEVAPASAGRQADPVVVADGAGGAFVAWTEERAAPSGLKVYLQHVAADGTLADSSGIPLGSGAIAQILPQLLTDGAGGVFAAWYEYSSPTSFELHAQHIVAGGSATWGSGALVTSGFTAPTANGRTVVAPALAPDSAGGIFVAWIDASSGNGRTYATRLGGDGQVVVPWPAGGTLTNGDAYYQSWPVLSPDGSGGIYVAWLGRPMTATHLRGDGSRAAGWPSEGKPLCTNGPDYCSWAGAPAYLFPDGAGGAIGAWQEWRSYPYPNGYDWQISFAQRIFDEGPVSALAALVSAQAVGGRVQVEWWTAATGTLRVDRAVGSADAGWSPLAPVSPDGESHVAIDDGDVTPGQRYGYRLVRSANGSDATLDETWIMVPLPGSLRIAGAGANPARGDLRVALDLPFGSSAAIDVMDAAGRRVLASRADGLGVGEHQLALAGSSALPAGIYLLRLSQAGRTATARICLLR